MAKKGKCPKCPPEGAADWLLTYGDMTTLLLTFFVIMVSAADVDGYELQLIIAAFNGVGPMEGGNTLSPGILAELGNTIEALPSMKRGRGLDTARKAATSLFKPETKNQMVKVTHDERGLVISMAADAFFKPASAEIDIEASRETLQKIARLLTGDEVSDRSFRLEGHTDQGATDPDGPWPTNWELSTDRAANVLHYLVDFGVNEKKMQIAGYGDTQPVGDNSTEEGRAENRRVDLIILAEGHE